MSTKSVSHKFSISNYCKINKKTCIGIGILGVLLLICIILFIIYLNKHLKSNNTDSTTESTYNKDAVNSALVSAGIKTSTTENFQNNTIVYDSIDKIKQNFETFINTFIPILDVNLMNKMLKEEYGVNKTLQEIINENNNLYFKQYINFLINIIKFINIILTDKTDIILAGIGLIILIKVSMENPSDYYYLNDYEKMNEFIIYSIPSSFDKTKINSTNTDIIFSKLEDSNILPYKIGLTRESRNIMRDIIIDSYSRTSGNPNTISEQDIDNGIRIFKENKEALLKYCRLLLIGPFIKLDNNTDLSNTSKIVVDLINLLTPNKYLTNEMSIYLAPSEQMNIMYMVYNRMFTNPASMATDIGSYMPTRPTMPIINNPSLSSTDVGSNVIELYSDKDYTGNVFKFDLSIANILDPNPYSIMPRISIYNATNNMPPPGSIKFPQSTNSLFTYFVGLYYESSNNMSSEAYLYNSSNIEPTQLYTNNNEQIISPLKYIFIYKELKPESIMLTMPTPPNIPLNLP